MFTVAISLLIALFQGPAPQTGVIVGMVKVPDAPRQPQSGHVLVLPPKYIEMWNKQVQQRLDNYWEIFKPEFAVNKEHFADFNRMAQVEAFRYTSSTMRRELGEGANKFIKDAAPNGQFEFRGIPFGTYQVLVQALFNGKDMVWSKPVEVQSEVPIFIDLGKPVS